MFKTVVDRNIKIIKVMKNQIILDSDFLEVGKVREFCRKRSFTSSSVTFRLGGVTRLKSP